MRCVSKPAAFALVALVIGTGAWVGGQALLVAAHARESAAEVTRIEIQVAAQAAARGVAATSVPSAETGSSYWGPILLGNTVQLVALAALGLALLMAGRRRAWVGLGLVAMIRPDLAVSPLRWLSPIGYGWWGPWVQGGSAVGESSPGLPLLPHVGALVDLLVIAAPAIAYLLATRGAPRPDVVPIRQVLARLAVPFVLIGGALALYATIDLDGQPYERVVAVLLVVSAAGLLATSWLGPVHAVLTVSVVAGLAAPEVSSALASVVAGGPGAALWSTVLTNTAPLFVLAVVGAACAAHGPAVASSYRRLVRRPATVHA